ncbi:MAG: S49 family peptidase [Deltaproteobacteria bacterium]|nr:S49 family peptidase [Deltaproteobacteria bacterium]
MPTGKTETAYPLLAASFFGKCWALEPGKLDEILSLAEAIQDGKKIDWPAAATGKSGLRAEESYQVQDGVAVIPVYGVLDKRMNMFSAMSGGTSYELLGQQIQQALADPNVSAIVLDVESPGGSVDGVKTVADQILAARGQKPLVAFANGQMTSAAYWIGSAADQVMANDTAMVGSLGVRMVHRDLSAQDAQKGIKRTVIYAGKYKNVGSDAEPLSEEDHQVLQARADTLYQLFLDGVARNRGQDPAVVHQEMGDGKIFIGQAAQAAGLVDQIGEMPDALAMAKNMAPQKGQRRQSMDRATLESQHPELFAEVKALGAAEAQKEMNEDCNEMKKEGARAERNRVVEMLEYEGDAALTLAAVKEGKSFADLVKADRQAEKEGKAQGLQGLQGQATSPLGQQPSGGGTPGTETFEAKVQQLMDGKQLSRSKAIIQAAQDFPELHADYIKRANPQKK